MEQIPHYDAAFNPDSVAIYRVEYDSTDQLMTIYFVNNGIGYEFFNVPRLVMVEFEAASSQGKYYNQNIRGRYQQ